MVCVACDDPKAEPFRIASKASQRALGLWTKGSIDLMHGSFGSRRDLVSPETLAAIESVDAGNRKRHHFGVARVTAGALKDLCAVGVGSNSDKRERACKAALTVAAFRGPLPPGAARPDDNFESVRKVLEAIDFKVPEPGERGVASYQASGPSSARAQPVTPQCKSEKCKKRPREWSDWSPPSRFEIWEVYVDEVFFSQEHRAWSSETNGGRLVWN